MLDLNLTLFFQLANFFVALLVLNILLIQPIRQVLKKRKEIVDGLTDEAEGFESQAEKSLADYEEALQKARQDAVLCRQKGREDAVAYQQSMISAAQKEARTIIAQTRDSLQKDADATLAALRAESGKLSSLLAERILSN